MPEETAPYHVDSVSLAQANLANPSQSQSKQVRLTLSHPQHRALLQSIAAQLGTTSLKAALEHVLNCWMVGNVPPSLSAPTIAPATESDDEFSALMEF